jgi:hypothetical protein
VSVEAIWQSGFLTCRDFKILVIMQSVFRAASRGTDAQKSAKGRGRDGAVKTPCIMVCKRNIEMTPLCKVEVTLPRVLGSWELHHGGGVDEQAGVQPA